MLLKLYSYLLKLYFWFSSRLNYTLIINQELNLKKIKLKKFYSNKFK